MTIASTAHHLLEDAARRREAKHGAATSFERPAVDLTPQDLNTWLVSDQAGSTVGYISVTRGLYEVSHAGESFGGFHFTTLATARDYFSEYASALALMHFPDRAS